MCRFALYIGEPITLSSLITQPEHSIIRQSYKSKEREEPLNGDGFGVAWYDRELSKRPAVFRDVSPAWNNQNLINISRVTRSPCILAHIRAATAGLPVTQLNCHPFAWGPFAFMHNGTVGGFHAIRRRIRESLSDEAYEAVLGSTDSEHVFGLFIDRYQEADGKDTIERMASALLAAISDVERFCRKARVTEPSLLNMAMSDGHCAVVTRYISDGSEDANTLYVQTGRVHVGEEGVVQVLPPEGGINAAVVASEPLGTAVEWTRVQPNELVIVYPDCTVEHRPIVL